MVDFRPLLFANALIVMLLVTAGFASLKSEIGLPAKPVADRLTPELDSRPAVPARASAFTPPPSADEISASPQTTLAPEELPVAAADQHSANAVTKTEHAVQPDEAPPAPKLKVKPEAVEAPTMAAKAGVAEVASEVTAEVKPEPEPQTESSAEPAPGTLTVRSNVFGDRVSVNGRDYGSTRLDLDLPAGEYQVIVSKAGHQTFETTVQLAAGAQQRVNAELAPLTTVHYRDGTWRAGVISGDGTYEDAEGLRYEGEFRNRQFHGKGQATFANGDQYSGEWRNGKPEGRGTLRLANGDIYSGQFAAGVYNGEGTLTTAGGDIYAGNWAGGSLNGQGTLTTAEGLLYVGGFRNGKFQGEGTLTYPDGRYYEGGFAEGNFHGKGSLIFADGKKYEGQFMDGQYHGHGDLFNPNGSRIAGNFRYGDPYGQAKLITPEGEVFTARTSEPGVCYRENSYRATQCPPMPGW